MIFQLKSKKRKNGETCLFAMLMLLAALLFIADDTAASCKIMQNAVVADVGVLPSVQTKNSVLQARFDNVQAIVSFQCAKGDSMRITMEKSPGEPVGNDVDSVSVNKSGTQLVSVYPTIVSLDGISIKKRFSDFPNHTFSGIATGGIQRLAVGLTVPQIGADQTRHMDPGIYLTKFSIGIQSP